MSVFLPSFFQVIKPDVTLSPCILPNGETTTQHSFAELVILKMVHILSSVATLCVVNGIFCIAGIILNCLVILCLWKCSQLRKKLCYFLILILSCCDLIVVMVSHPLIISLSLIWAEEGNRIWERKVLFGWINDVLFGLSSIALLTMNIERYLSTAHPLFHRRSVTKRRLVALLTTLQFVDFATVTALAFQSHSAHHICSIIVLLVLLAMVIFMNYKIFRIAMAAKRNGTNDKKSAVNFKTASTCLLAVSCFFCTSIPLFFYYIFELLQPFNDDASVSFYLWAVTAISMDSTFNCFLFFWRNRILRTEGKKILNKRFRFGMSRVYPA